MSKAALFIRAPNYKLHKCSSTEQIMYSYTIENCPAIKKERLLHATTWMNPTMMSKSSQTQQTSHCKIPLTRGSRTVKMSLCILTGRGTRGAFWDNENVLHLELCHVYMDTINSLSCTLRFSHFKLYSNSRLTQLGSKEKNIYSSFPRVLELWAIVTYTLVFLKI